MKGAKCNRKLRRSKILTIRTLHIGNPDYSKCLDVKVMKLKMSVILKSALNCVLCIGACLSLLPRLSAEHHENEETVKLAVIGGSTIDRRHVGKFFADGVADTEKSFTLKTEAGTSPTIYKMRYEGIPFYYVRYHGFSDVEAWESSTDGGNFVTMFAAFYQLGATHIIGGATSGGIQPTYRKGDLIIADDYLNFNFERPSSVLVAANIQRPGIRAKYNPPFCPDIRDILYRQAVDTYKNGRVFKTGVVVQSDASRFETPAEIRFYRTAGADLVTLNVATEAIYARQLGLHYAIMMGISNPAEGVRPFTRDEEMDAGDKIAEGAGPIVLKALLILNEHEPQCGITCTGEYYSGQTAK